MIEYIGKMIDDILEDMKGEPETPDTHHFFDIEEDATKLSRTGAECFSSLCGATIIPVNESKSIHTAGSVIHMH